MPQCAKCSSSIKKDFSTCDSCNKTIIRAVYVRICAYLGSKSAWGCCLALLSHSPLGLRLATMTQLVNNTAIGNSIPSGPQTPLFSFLSGLIVPQQHLQAASVSGESASLVPQQHPHAATVSKEMSRFNNLDSEAKMSPMYEFVFTLMKRLESRLNKVARTTSERFSQVDARLQALKQRVVGQTDLMNQPRKLLYRACPLEVSYHMKK